MVKKTTPATRPAQKYNESREMYKELINRQTSLWLAEDSIQVKSLAEYDRIGDFSRIEGFIESLRHGPIPTYDKHKKQEHPSQQYLDYFRYLKNTLILIDSTDVYEYSENITAFMEVCTKMHIQDILLSEPDDHVSLALGHKSDAPQLLQREVFEQLMTDIQERLRSSTFTTRSALRKKSASDAYDVSRRCLNGCFDQSDDLFILRLDLGYLKRMSEPLTVSRVDANELKLIKAELATLMKHLSSAKKFSDLLSCLAKLEYGSSKGYFFHLVLIFKHDKDMEAEDWAKLVGNHWINQITKGKGAFHSCNQEWVPCGNNYEAGQIHKSDEAMRTAVMNGAIRYMAKSSLYMKVKVPPRERVFFSSMKKIATPNSLLPRSGNVAATTKSTKSQEMKSLFLEVKFQRNSVVMEKNRVSSRAVQFDFSLIQKIEIFIDMLSEDLRPVFFIDETVQPSVILTSVGKHFLDFDVEHVLSAIGANPQAYSLNVRVFYEAILHYPKEARALFKNHHVIALQVANQLNSQLDYIRRRINSAAHRKKNQITATMATANFKRCSGYLDDMLQAKRDLTVVCLDLFLGKNDPDLFSRLFSKMIKNGGRSKPLCWMVGYIGRWYFTPDKGLHAHVLFFIDQAKVSNPKEFIPLIGQYWAAQSTDYAGSYYPASIAKSSNDLPDCIAHISSKDKKKIKALKEVTIKYLTMTDLYFQDIRIEMPKSSSELTVDAPYKPIPRIIEVPFQTQTGLVMPDLRIKKATVLIKGNSPKILTTLKVKNAQQTIEDHISEQQPAQRSDQIKKAQAKVLNFGSNINMRWPRSVGLSGKKMIKDKNELSEDKLPDSTEEK